MAWTIENLNTLKAAIAEGATVVKYGDKEVRYMSLSDMLRVKALIEEELGLTKAMRRVGDFHNGK